MNIDFFHVDLLPKTSVKGISEAYSKISVDNHLSLNNKPNDKKNNKPKEAHYYNDILNELHRNTDDELVYKNNQFISDDYLLNLKKSIEENNYRINDKVLLISLIKYIERI